MHRLDLCYASYKKWVNRMAGNAYGNSLCVSNKSQNYS